MPQVVQKASLVRRDLLELKQGKKVYGHWKQGQVTQGDYRDAISHCREKIHVDKGHLELGIAVKDNKKSTF